MGRIVIVGAGAVGSYYGARLAQAGEDVTFLLRADYQHVKEHGLEVRSVAGDFHLDDVQCARSAEEIGPVDLALAADEALQSGASRSECAELRRCWIPDAEAIIDRAEALGLFDHEGDDDHE